MLYVNYRSSATRLQASVQDSAATTTRGFTTSRAGTTLSALTGTSGTAGATALVVSGSGHFDSTTSRRDFLSYALSLMRSHNSEHSDSLPVLDVASMKHIAYVFDALIYYMRSGNDLDLKNAPPLPTALPSVGVLPGGSGVGGGVAGIDPRVGEGHDEGEDQLDENGRRHIFFQRSESTLCLGKNYFAF